MAWELGTIAVHCITPLKEYECFPPRSIGTTTSPTTASKPGNDGDAIVGGRSTNKSRKRRMRRRVSRACLVVGEPEVSVNTRPTSSAALTIYHRRKFGRPPGWSVIRRVVGCGIIDAGLSVSVRQCPYFFSSVLRDPELAELCPHRANLATQLLKPALASCLTPPLVLRAPRASRQANHFSL